MKTVNDISTKVIFLNKSFDNDGTRHWKIPFDINFAGHVSGRGDCDLETQVYAVGLTPGG